MSNVPGGVRFGLSTGLGRAMMALAIAACCGVAQAHDFWLTPSTFKPEVGQVITMSLFVGDEFPGEPVARKDERVEAFSARGPSGQTVPVVGRDGAVPAGICRLTEPGSHVAWYRGKPVPITLEAAKFESYLKEEGLDRVVEARKARGEVDKPGREIYSRCAKTIVQVVEASGAGAKPEAAAAVTSADSAGATAEGAVGGVDQPVGTRLEITPLIDPRVIAPGDAEKGTIGVRITFEGKPLEGVLLTASSPEGHARGEKPVEARSDAEGKAEFVLAQGGMWLIAGVHMFEAPKDSGADWESLWASLTFHVGPKVEAGGSADSGKK